MGCGDVNDQVEALRGILYSGVVQTSMDGQTTTFASPQELRKALRDAQSKDLVAVANNQVRPPMMRCNWRRF